ncbi:MAG: hypothetical protein RBT34_13040 [Anaerolineaceae bacterium]|jgi:hypothetical protein|nr:hypothetical protein [Anaerolineaceae bacterium]
MLTDTVIISLHNSSSRQNTTVFGENQSKLSNFYELRNFHISSETLIPPLYSEAYHTMLASEKILREDWNSPEEDTAWANL